MQRRRLKVSRLDVRFYVVEMIREISAIDVVEQAIKKMNVLLVLCEVYHAIVQVVGDDDLRALALLQVNNQAHHLTDDDHIRVLHQMKNIKAGDLTENTAEIDLELVIRSDIEEAQVDQVETILRKGKVDKGKTQMQILIHLNQTGINNNKENNRKAQSRNFQNKKSSPTYAIFYMSFLNV